MSRPINLGVFVRSDKPFKADLNIVLRSNVLVQANSGGGKSWLLRRMIEQAYHRVPQIVIDPEGEFSTLREKFDFVLVGKGGDTPADIRSAPLLAHRLLELGASAVIDLFEMSKPLRPVWVAAFIQALVDAPKKLWRDLLVYVDEAHELAPEAGHGAHESRDEKLCRHALIDLAAKGRKRGYGTVAATQRLGKLSKDFAAELKNVLIGQTFIDIDRERAAACLGIAKGDKPQFFKDVKTLEPGNFHSLGRAFTLEAALVQIGDVETEHPEAGRRQSSPPPPTSKIRHLLPQLADLPKEAEEKIQTEKELKMKISEQQRRIAELERAAKIAVPPPIVQKVGKTVEVSVFREADLKRIEKLADRLGRREDTFVEQFDAVSKRFGDVVSTATQKLADQQKAVHAAIDKLVRSGRFPSAATTPNVNNAPKAIRGAKPGRRETDKPNGVPMPNESNKDLSRCARALLAVLASRGVATDSQVSALSGYRKTSSGFTNSLSELRTQGLITGSRDRLQITEAGREVTGPVEPPPKGKALLDYWLPKLTKCEAALLGAIYKDGTISREALSERTGYRTTSSGFTNSISGLRVLDLVHGPNGGDLTIADVFKE